MHTSSRNSRSSRTFEEAFESFENRDQRSARPRASHLGEVALLQRAVQLLLLHEAALGADAAILEFREERVAAGAASRARDVQLRGKDCVLRLETLWRTVASVLCSSHLGEMLYR